MPRRPPPRRLPAKLRKILSDLAGSLAHSYAQRLRRDLFAALRLHHWLMANPVTSRPVIAWRDPIYRIVYRDFDPLSVAGSLADGGRFNIGGAQQLPANVLPGMRKAACLYGASTIHCAKVEAAEPLGHYRMFRLVPKKPLNLWDLGAVLSVTKYPGLAARVNATPMSQRWALQKSPLESQILAHHLQDIGGDGIIHSSQKDANGQVLAFFCKDDLAVLQAFDAIEEPADGSNQ
jgi:hypothetical protein